MHVWNCSCNYNYKRFFPELYDFSTALIMIQDSKFTNSRIILKFNYQYNENRANWPYRHRLLSLDIKITIKDTIIKNCSESHYQRAIIYTYIDRRWFNNDFYELLHIKLVNVNITDNNSPLFATRKLNNYILTCLFITFTGHSNFIRNKGGIIETQSRKCEDCSIVTNKVLFSTVEINITNNTSTLYGSPFLIGNGEIVFENCRVVLSGNHGTVSGGIQMYSETKMVFNNNVFIEFNNNIGQKGGALSFGPKSRMVFNATNSSIMLKFINNSAQRGGAIFVDDCGYSSASSFNFHQADSLHGGYNLMPVFNLQCSTELVTLTFL